MTSFEPTCTEPGRWNPAPEAEAPANEILAYLQHCDLCEFHAMLNLEDDLSLDVLLRDACRDLVIDDVERPAGIPERGRAALMPWLRRADRAPRARTLQDSFRFERRLTHAFIAAFSIVVLWISFTAYQFAQTPPPEELAASMEEEAPPAENLFPGQLAGDMRAGHLYLSQILNEYESGQHVQGGTLHETDQLTAIAPRQVGTVLRVTNPGTGLWVKVKIVERSYEEREIFLSSQAADSLGLDSTAIVFVEVIHTPPSMGLAP